MCGIVGAFCLHDSSSSPTDGFTEALERLERRGPDGDGLFEGPGVAFGHRRLAVIDIEGGPQPWIDSETGTVLVYNGEIYNHDALRDQLASRGHTFRSRSDTEVLCRAYLEWGVDCVEHLVGMFAFAVWDPREERVFIARDRLGVKPLFYALDGERLAFASNVSAMRALPGVSGTLDLDAVSHYLTTVRLTLGDRTLLRDVHSLEPGCAMVVSRGGDVRRWRWWEIPVVRPGDKESIDLDEASRGLRALLEESIGDRLISDVPVGSFLSGGVDSAVVAAVAHPRVDEPLTTYSVGFPRAGYNEWPFVQETVEHLGVENRAIQLSEEGYLEFWGALVAEKGMPLSTPNEVGIFHVAHALRQECVVALTGEGADEVLGGYTIPYFSAYDFDRAAGATDDGLSLALRRLYGRNRFSSRLEHFFLLNSWMPTSAKWGLLESGVSGALQADDAVCAHYGSMFDSLSECSTLDAYMHVHARVNLEGLLARVDSSTMAASVEARVPFTDHRLVEFAFQQPDSLKLDWLDEAAAASGADMNVMEIDRAGLIDSKRMLRRAFEPDLPERIVRRPKMSFPTPFMEAFSGSLLDSVTSVVESSPLMGTLFRPDAVRRLVGSKNVAVWPVANLCLWSLADDGIGV